MSSIDEKIQILLRKKAKITLLNTVRELLLQLPTDPDGHKNLTQEVSTMVNTFLDAAISGVETSEAAPTSTGHLNSQELASIRQTAQTITATDSEPPPFKPSDPRVVAERKLKVDFAKANQKFAGREIRFTAEDNSEKSGKVVALAYPNLVVELEEGRVLVSPENIL